MRASSPGAHGAVHQDSDLNGVVDVRYTGGAKLLLLIEVGQGRWRFKVPVLVSDLDLECKVRGAKRRCACGTCMGCMGCVVPAL